MTHVPIRRVEYDPPETPTSPTSFWDDRFSALLDFEWAAYSDRSSWNSNRSYVPLTKWTIAEAKGHRTPEKCCGGSKPTIRRCSPTDGSRGERVWISWLAYSLRARHRLATGPTRAGPPAVPPALASAATRRVSRSRHPTPRPLSGPAPRRSLCAGQWQRTKAVQDQRVAPKRFAHGNHVGQLGDERSQRDVSFHAC